MNIKEALTKGQNFSLIIKNLWSAMSDELDVISKNENYPFFFRQNIWSLIQVDRTIIILKENYAKGMNDCIPNNWEDIVNINDLTNDQNFMQIYRSHGGKSPVDAYDVPIYSNAFENGGVALTFWGSENLNELEGKEKSVFVGYINNNRVYEYLLIPQNYTVVHRLKIFDKYVDIKSDANCATYYFVILSIQKDCDHYKLIYSVRFLASNSRHGGEIELNAEKVENLHFIFDRNNTISNTYYKNFKYTRSVEVPLISYSLNSASWKTFIQRATCAPNCQYSNGNRCLFCKSPTYNNGGSCVSQCPNSTFINNQTCEPCNDQCLTCNGPNNGNCLKCKEPLYLSNGVCDPKCPMNLAPDSDRICKPCGANCNSCKDIKTCGVCDAVSFLKDGQCVPNCGEKFFKSFNPNVCRPCQNGCQTCESADKCNSCTNGFFLKGKDCVPGCGDEFWADTVTKTCKQCESNCKVCKDSVNCVECNKGFHNYNQDCVSNCPLGTVSVNGVCVKCTQQECEVCSGNNVADCKKCNNSNFLKDAKCVNNCGTGFYADTNKNCQTCPKDCNVCTKEKCLQCKDNQFVLSDTICVNECPDGYISSGNTCVKCTFPSVCKKCMNNNLETCTKCYNGMILFNGKCLDKCPEKYFANGDVCEPCSVGCDSCKNKYNCLVCSKTHFWQNNVCVNKCETGFTAIGNNVCQPCKVLACETCSRDVSICEKCPEKKYLYNNQCIEKCPLGAYPLPTMTCDTCTSECIECTNKSTCTKCKPGKVLQGTNCLSVCDDGFVPINGECTKCKNMNCRRCLSTDLSKCTECPVGSFLYNGDCVKLCPSKTYPLNGVCLDCKSPCNACKSDSECVDCIPKFSLHGKNCTDNCPTRTVSINNVCHTCNDKNCLKCRDVVANTCIQCDNQFVLFNGACVQTCPENYFNENGVCKPCLANCKKCKNSNTCDECIDKFNLKDGNQCVKECGDGYTLFPQNICRKCHSSCLGCKNTNVNECTKCYANYYLFNNECRSSCPEATFATNKMTCDPCPISNCLECRSGNTCTKCNTNYVLENNTCRLPPCSEGWVVKPSSNECTKCEVNNCKSCPNTNLKKCDNCISNYFLIGDYKCEKDCIIGTYKNLTSKKCENCPANCLTCTDSLHCSQCDINFYLYEGVCVSQCPTGYSKLNGKCMPCEVKSCDVCPDNKNCEKCKVPLVLQDGLCEKDCKKAYFSNGGLCKKCPLFCDECENEQKCKVCQKGKILSADSKCIDECPSGSVQVGVKCVLCQSDPKCEKCSSTDLKQCLSCNGNLVLKSNTCVDNCGDNFYINTRKCSPCKQNCKKCQDGNTCLECDNGYALYQDNCVSNCPSGFRKENGKCLACSADCLTCDTKQCLQCLNGILLENGSCVKQCSKGYYTLNKINCHPCEAGCISCLTDKSCNICRESLFLKEGKCVEKCGEGFVAISGKCEKCELNCVECNKLNSKECLVCSKGKVLLNGQCIDKCPAKYYLENVKCLPCLSGCDVCQNDKTCDKCTPPLLLGSDKKTCINSCPDGYRANQGVCAPCEDKKCQKCGSSSNICEVCNTPNLLFNGVCVSICPDGYHRDETGKKCEKCVESCTKCVGKKTCTECAKGFSLQEDECVNVCKPGSISVNSVCKICETTNCEICKTNLSTCERCDKGKVLFTVTNSTLNLVANITRKVVINNTARVSNSTVGINSTLCIDNCPVGFYESNRVCNSCGENCDKCSNGNQCNLCSSGYVLQDGKCQKRCNKYFVEKNGECVRCEDQKCVNCDPLTRKECKVCDENYVLKNNECKSNCGSSFFKFEVSKDNNVCKPCSFKCDVCSSANSCDKCMDGTFLKNKECVPDCGKGWVVKDNSKCIECTSKNCVVCDPNNPDRCITCTSDTYLKAGLCVKTCGDKYFGSDKGLCLPCVDPSCITCSPNDKCKVCDKGKVVLNGVCQNNCPSGMVADKDNVCVSCKDKNCNKCDANDLSKCSQCNNGYLLQPDLTCNSKCPAKYYNHLNERCLPCSNNCDICRNEKECTVCSGKMVLDQNNMCTDKCEKGYVEVQGKCVKCKDKNCAKCQSNDQAICEVCLPGFYLYKGECVSSCPEKTFALGSNCVNCDANCLKCNSETDCKVCDKTYLLFNKVCVKNCPEGYHDQNGECFKCPNYEKTKSCDRQNPIIPLACKDKYLLDKVCVETCPDGKFPDSKKTCQNCGPECLKCGSLTDCKKCSSKTVLYKGNCTNTCPLGTVNVSGECVDCKNQNCNECQPSDLTKCTSCKDKLFLVNNDCLSNCPSGYYPQGKICQKCDSKCGECKNEKTCDKCLNQFVNHNGTCVSECPKGYALRNGNCFACVDKKCNQCDNVDLNKCVACREGYLFNKICNDVCPTGYRADNSTRSCVPCSKYCDKCDENGCLVCSKGFYFSEADKRFCIECTETNLVIVNNNCETCKVQGCKRCIDGNTNSCKLCDSAKVLVDGKCLDKCPNGTFKVDQTCQPCDKGCKVCSNSKTCDECEKPNVVFNGKCVPNCPLGWVNNNKGSCVQCAQQDCDVCDSSNTGLCLVCKLPSMLYKGQCNKVCPIGTFPDSPNCKDCPNGCSICNKNQCEGCSNNLLLKGSECVKECGTGYYVNGGKCEKCIDSNCAICAPANICKKCNPNTYLMEGTNTCVVTCKDGYYMEKDKGVCTKCDQGCSNCNGKNQCSVCEKGLYLLDGQCDQDCPDGYSAIAGFCKPCEKGCSGCSNDPNFCVTCAKGYLYEKKCIPVCPKGTYVEKGKCESCDKRCDECVSKYECLKCKSEFNIYQGRCIDRCSDGKVEINGKCVSCADKNCKNCLRDTSICVECNTPFVINDNSCRPNCPDGTFAGPDRICVPCADGCSNCTNDSNCSKCLSGFFLYKNKCVKECPKRMYGNCSDNLCYNCLEACEDCVDGTATNCTKCSESYFKNGNVCVKDTGCRNGTYPNKELRRCSTCRIPFCASCLDQTRCKECVRGFELNKKGDCVVSKTFIPVIGQNGRLFSSKTIKLFRSNEIKTFNQDLKGTGVNSDNISFTFWLRRISEIPTTTKVFETESGSVAMNIKLEIINVEGKPTCRLLLVQDTNINALDLGSCSYQDLYTWTFFSFTLSQVNEKGTVDVRIVNNKGVNRLRNLDFPISKTVTFINKDSSLVFNKNLNKDDVLASSPFEIANFNILDYDATAEDIQEHSLLLPNDCDYTCLDCKTQCNLCPGNIKPTSEGFCPASFISFLTDYQVLSSAISVELRHKVTQRLDSERYGLFIWFNSQTSLNNSTEIGTVYYNYPQSDIIIRFFVKNTKLWIQVGQESFEVFDKYTLTSDEWYFIGASVKTQSLVVYLRDLTQINDMKVINLKSLPNRLTEDSVFFTGPIRELNNTSTNFTGSFYDIRLYINNVPNDDDINNQYSKLPCPKNCMKCTKSLTCGSCNKGFKLENNNCVDSKLSTPVELLDKYSFFRNDTLALNIPSSFNLSQYTISFFYRRKIHSLESPLHNVLNIEATDGRTYALIQQLNGINDKSTFNLLGQNSTGSVINHDFSNEIYNFIHFIITVDIPKKTITYFINDGTEQSFTKPIMTGIRKFILGDSSRIELNFEIGNFFIFEGLVGKEDFPKLRTTVPLDCDPGCISCDYKTGACLTCLSGKPTETKDCSNVLRGFSFAHLFNVHTLDQNLGSQYSSSLNSVYKKDVNSLEYSVIGYFRLFNKKAITEKKNAKFQLFRVSNRADNLQSSSNNLVGLEILSNNSTNVSNYYITYNDGKVIGNHLVKDLEVTTEWVLFLASINVKEKTIKYAIQQLNSARVYLDTIKLNNYPEKLVELANLNLFGYGAGSLYHTLDIQFFRFYLGVNMKYNVELIEKFKKNLPVPEDPKCPADCERCILSEKQIVQCLSCVKGYELENDQCFKLDSKYIFLADQNVYTFLPPKTDLAVPSSASLHPKNTITFYFRRNYSPKVQPSDITIFRGGNVEIKLNGAIKGESSLVVSVNKYPNSLLFNLDSNLTEDYNWYLVIINYSSNVLDVIVKNDQTNVKKGLTVDNNFKIEITSISFNTLKDQVSIYAPNIILRNFYEIDFVKPSTFCNLECDVCIENKCVECHWGFDENGACIKNPITIPVFRVTKGSEFANQYSLRKYLDNPRPLRSRSWGIRFTFELTGSFNSYAQNGGNSLFTLTNGDNIGNSNLLFNINLNPNNSFFITVTNRYYVTELGSSYGFTTNSFKTEPLNLLYIVAISYNDDTNQLEFYAYNSHENYIKQTFILKGRGENLNLDANLIFGSGFTNSTQQIIFEHAKFYFDGPIGENTVNQFLDLRLHTYQNSCLQNTRISCLKCSSNSNLVGNVCSPVKNSLYAMLNKVKQITNFMPETVEQKFFFTNNSTQFTVSFWFKFYSYIKDPFGILSLTMQDGKLSHHLLKIHYNNNNMFIDLYDSTQKQVNGIKYDNMVLPTSPLGWMYISVSVDIPSNTINVYTHDHKQKKNRILTNSLSNVKPNLVLNSSKYAVINVGYETTLKGVGFHFEASSIIFTSGWFAKDSNELELYRLRVPRKCNYRCLHECDSFNLCPAKGYLSGDINIDNIYSNNAALKGKTDPASMKSINLFRFLSLWLPDTDGSPVWSDFLLSFELDVPSLLSSTYKPNNNIILALTNSPSPSLASLTMNDIIPSEIIQYGVLGIETTNEGIKFWVGSSLAGNTITYYNLNLQTLNGIGKITIQLFMDSTNQKARIIAYIDDLRTFYDINTVYPLQSISMTTLIYSHPLLYDFRINVNNSRFIYDYNLNIKGKSQDMTNFASKRCGADCLKCSFVPKGMIFSCDRCQKGYVLINNICVKSNNL